MLRDGHGLLSPLVKGEITTSKMVERLPVRCVYITAVSC